MLVIKSSNVDALIGRLWNESSSVSDLRNTTNDIDTVSGNIHLCTCQGTKKIAGLDLLKSSKILAILTEISF